MAFGVLTAAGSLAASYAQAGGARDYSFHVHTTIPTLCAVRNLSNGSPVVEGDTDDGQPVFKPLYSGIVVICNTPGAIDLVRVRRISYRPIYRHWRRRRSHAAIDGNRLPLPVTAGGGATREAGIAHLIEKIEAEAAWAGEFSMTRRELLAGRTFAGSRKAYGRRVASLAPLADTIDRLFEAEIAPVESIDRTQLGHITLGKGRAKGSLAVGQAATVMSLGGRRIESTDVRLGDEIILSLTGRL